VFSKKSFGPNVNVKAKLYGFVASSDGFALINFNDFNASSSWG